LSCAKLLSDSSVNLVSGDSTIIELPAKLKEIYIFCILSEHYPALAFQADQFIQAKRLDTIMPPFILDIFTLDAVAEMLNTPLYFLSYGNRRTNYASKIKATHELTILAYHLKQNLWIDSEYDFVQLGDDISSDLDIAMLSRRNGVPGAKTPEGILTKFTNTRVGQLIKQIEDRDDRSTIDLGFILLTLSEESVNQLSRGIEAIINYSKSDGKNHDISMGLKGLDCGITIHSNFDSNAIALERLTWHCEIRKYSERTLYWYGICLEPKQGNIRFGLNLEHPWEQSDQMDEALAKLPKGKKLLDLDSNTKKQKTKIGRNDPCPCGSGKKYKYCCLNRT
jgi:hypothetical protein